MTNIDKAIRFRKEYFEIYGEFPSYKLTTEQTGVPMHSVCDAVRKEQRKEGEKMAIDECREALEPKMSHEDYIDWLNEDLEEPIVTEYQAYAWEDWQ